MTRRTLPILSIIIIALTSQQDIMSQQEREAREADSLPEYYDADLARRHLTPDKRGGKDELFSDELNDISMIQLIANPEKYHQKAVRIQGFFHFEDEESGVFLSVESANYLNTRNGIWITIGNLDRWTRKKMRPEMFNKKHIVISGIFNKNKHGHMGMWSGEISDVWLVYEAKKYYND